MKIVAISDTHNEHHKLTIPVCDVLIHAGDFTKLGSLQEIANFSEWFSKQPATHKLCVSGNHERSLDYKSSSRSIAENLLKEKGIHYLLEDEIVIDGVKFYGSPWQPRFYDWAFNLPRGEALKQKWDLIPDDVDVLITHSPPYGFLDSYLELGATVYCGCEDLKNKVLQLKKLKTHIYGHIHASYGSLKFLDVLYVNAAICDGKNIAVNEPVEVEI